MDEVIALTGDGATVDISEEPGILHVSGLATTRIAEIAADAGVVLHELTLVTGSLEDAYLALTRHDVEYRTGEPT